MKKQKKTFKTLKPAPTIQTTGNEKEVVVKELHRLARRAYPRRRTIIKGIDDLWQGDLADFTLFSRENKGYKYILVVIDCFSKFLFTRFLKNKTGITVTKAFDDIIKTSKRKPKNLQTDKGTEFYNKSFNGLMQKHRINHYSTYSNVKASMAERVIRTLKNKLYQSFSLRGSYKYYDTLDKITTEYNNQKHRTIGMRPIDVTKNKEQRLLQTVFTHIKIAGKRKFKVNDIVRISKQKAEFEKGYTPNWSTELFKIKDIKVSNPTVYYLTDMKGLDILGTFYEQELQRAAFNNVYLIEKVVKQKGAKLLVKWLGFDKSHNSWIDKNDIV